ncbi:MAG: AbrB/MazE/SpoVT family DNA-binding domain-containing protein [Hydrogenophaga sp.]|uniref:AbrB/MazE/SpoVT family DNA-binding domain-containing protein n=1 Tax=Hydrogenophaga sp. TaxID=1904254 RepID=UPI0027158430|nr:AbrB/MazE/SpoVT family DNA-binding domain-containing protein [Hydrogenophaga sp.]MDO9480751.1 AbrB/MazE/SpoVT family DNA-binding domain-containing protein [Hydrogenophaga sp.]MDP3347140.1 AbrB/MazE/SpoVT family DNA-binding domain-containing protein [Hydrogenophaga sp.]MDP3806275.1 AbrB/MazE/SpoVT family DNA-binding domain-containing protein [Hydrogenophaga sp.]MDP3923875.1 AbrB/MazE/SpoVT family DNA-binding domain-containing protein [Hydrogenophaga sp.]
MQTTLTSKGQVTIPREIRQHVGLKQGMAIRFSIEGDHIALRAVRSPQQGASSGFALIKSRRKAVPADLDVAGLSGVARPEGRIKRGSLLAHMGQQAGGFDFEIERDKSPAEPVRFERSCSIPTSFLNR